MPNYSIIATGSTGASFGICQLKSTSDQSKIAIYDLTIGSAATPADQATLFVLNRFTSAGTGAVLTPALALLDQFSATAIATGRGMLTTIAEGLTGMMLIPLNQRATFRWVAAPGSELMSRASPSTGIELKSQSASASYLANATILWTE